MMENLLKVSEAFKHFNEEMLKKYLDIDYSVLEKQILGIEPKDDRSELDKFIDDCVLGPESKPQIVGMKSRFAGYGRAHGKSSIWIDEYYTMPQKHPVTFKPTKKQVKSLKKRRLLKRTRGQA